MKRENQEDRIFHNNFEMLGNRVFLLSEEVLYLTKNIVLLEGRNGSSGRARHTGLRLESFD